MALVKRGKVIAVSAATIELEIQDETLQRDQLLGKVRIVWWRY